MQRAFYSFAQMRVQGNRPKIYLFYFFNELKQDIDGALQRMFDK